ncbi:hypothetical protein FACS1894156_1080 [Bacteroidia bacterium]|nr:hypothetical protein FACS1894156_1080 [Bacteroidia bacterium]
MSNLNLSGKDILGFLLKHYEFVHSAFDIGKPDFVIEQERFDTLVNEYNTSSETKISVSKLMDYKFCRKQPTGEYKISGVYTAFLEFIFDDFVLDLPETIKNRYLTITSNFTNLQTTTDENKIVLYITEIIKETEDFINDIQRQTYRLLRDTESLKVNADNFTDLTIRIHKANYWIDEYIVPLNTVVNREHPGSLYFAISNIQNYSSEKRFSADTITLRRWFEKLYGSAVNTKSELDQTIGKLTRELMPLLDRIKTNSLILSGFYHFIENIDTPENYSIPLPNFLRRERNRILSKNFEAEATFFIDQFNYKAPQISYIEETEEIECLPDTNHFKEFLLQESGSENFYQWCFDVLQTYTSEITLSKYFSVSNMVLEEDLEIEYNNDSRFEIQLADAILKMPKIKVYELSDRT